MGWIERIKNDIIIKTGDSKTYSPSWINATKGKEYNVSVFNFPLLKGSRVDKGEAIGTKYDLELFFQGDDHLERVAEFWLSADDKRPWTIYHPYYDVITVHPISFFQDNSLHNVSALKVSVIETIVDDAPRVNVSPVDTIKLKKYDLDIALEGALLAPPKAKDVTALSKDVNKNFKLAVPVIKMPDELQVYTNLFNVANTAINNATQSPLVAIRTTIALLNYPALLTQNVDSRVKLLQGQFESLRDRINVVYTLSAKQIYQITLGSVISSIAVTSALPLTTDFKNRVDVLNVIDIVVNNFNLYLKDMDLLQSDNGGSLTSFIPDPAVLIELQSLVFFAVSNLFDIAFNTRKEYVVYTTEDSNIISLTHRYYGLDDDDNNIDEMIAANNIGLFQLLQIKKGSRIVYYK